MCRAKLSNSLGSGASYCSMEEEIGKPAPTWNGGAGTWEPSEQDVMNYADGTWWEDRYLRGPRLVAKLTGAAATACIGRPRGWLSSKWGADILLEYLQKNVMRQPVEDVGRYMEEYFVKQRRRRGEGMAEYCLRVHESYQRLRVALARMIRKGATSHDKTLDTALSSIWPPDRSEAPDRSWCAVPERNDEGISEE